MGQDFPHCTRTCQNHTHSGYGGVGPLALLWCQGSLGVSSLDRCPGSSLLLCLVSFVCPAIQCLQALSPLLRALCLLPPAPHGDGGSIRPVPTALIFRLNINHSLVLLSLLTPQPQINSVTSPQPSALCSVIALSNSVSVFRHLRSRTSRSTVYLFW